MRKMIVVAVREYQAAVRTKAFIVMLVAMPIIMGGGIALQALLSERVDTRPKRVAVLDYTGRLYDVVAEAAKWHNDNEIHDENGKQYKPAYLFEPIRGVPADRDEAAYKLSQRVRNNEILAFVIIGPDVIHPRSEAEPVRVVYQSNTPTYGDVHRWLRHVITERVREIRLKDADLDPTVIAKATQPVPVDNLGLVSRDEAGNIIAAEQTNELANFFVPFGLLMLMFMVVQVGATPLIQSVLEEKMQRIAEVLLGSVSPFSLMMGKLLGMVGVALTIATLYLVGAFVAVKHAGYEQFFPGHLVFWFVLYQGLMVLLFGSIYIAVGAAVSDFREAQSLMMPAVIFVMIPLFVWVPVVKEPTSTFSTLISFFPPATPMLMVVRQAVPPGIPVWQPILGVALVIATTVACIFAAGRIFRVGILMQGKGANFREMARWVLHG